MRFGYGLLIWGVDAKRKVWHSNTNQTNRKSSNISELYEDLLLGHSYFIIVIFVIVIFVIVNFVIITIL